MWTSPRERYIESVVPPDYPGVFIHSIDNVVRLAESAGNRTQGRRSAFWPPACPLADPGAWKDQRSPSGRLTSRGLEQVPENDLRQTIMLHEDETVYFDDPWHLADYGDGWGAYAVRSDDPAVESSIKNAARRKSFTETRSRRRLAHRPRLL